MIAEFARGPAHVCAANVAGACSAETKTNKQTNKQTKANKTVTVTAVFPSCYALH